MIQKKSSPFLFFTLAIGFATALISLQTVNAEDENGMALGKIRFGKQTDDKWLKVDLRKAARPGLNTRSSAGGPTVVTNAHRQFNVRANRYSTDFLRNSAALAVNPNARKVYPQASSMVSNHKLLQAASIAVNNARGRSTGSCWRYVKSALLKAEAIDSYPKTGYAKQAASELVHDYGFVRTAISNPFSAPVGSVLVYGGAGAGHVEFRTRTGFVSDFVSPKPSNRPLIGVFVKR